MVSVLDFVGNLGAKGSKVEEALSEHVTNLFGGTIESMSLWVMSDKAE